MAGPGDLAGDNWLRVGHADRDQVVASLKDAFVAGMLTKDELDVRIGRALAARTRGDLAMLTHDLPPVPAGMGRPAAPAPAGAAAQDRHPRPLARASAQSAGFLALAFGMVAIAGQFDPGGPGPDPQYGLARPFLFLAFMFLIAAFGVLANGVASAAEQRSARRQAAEDPPPGPAGPAGPR